MAKRYDIVVPKKYQKDGEEKTAWKNVGSLVRFPATEEKAEGYILELNMFPDVTFKVFEMKPRDSEAPRAASRPAPKPEPKRDVEPEPGSYAHDDINPDDVPF